jgi:hypothetical protein
LIFPSYSSNLISLMYCSVASNGIDHARSETLLLVDITY